VKVKTRNPKLRIADCGLRIVNWKLQIVNWGLRIIDSQLRIANCEFRSLESTPMPEDMERAKSKIFLDSGFFIS
jgi:hypothetical protein